MGFYFAYIDESGDAGPADTGSKSFTLACILVDVARWPEVFDDVLGYRRYLRSTFGLAMRAEIKANYLLRNGGAFRELKLSEPARFSIYRGLMRLQAKLELTTFAIVIDKKKLQARGKAEDPRLKAWEYLVQRLERFTTKGNHRVMLVHDEGEADLIRRIARKARRIGSAGAFYGSGSLPRPARLIVEDPVPRKSHESYFLQLADLNAYAAFRRVFPPPPRPVHIVPETMWDELAEARLAAVSALKGGLIGIVAWP